TAVHELSLDIASGEFIVLLGPSGAGKTTTLRLVAGLETPHQGSVFIRGEDDAPARGRGPREARRGQRLHRRPRRHAHRAGAARRHLRLSAVLALSAPERLRPPRLSRSEARRV